MSIEELKFASIEEALQYLSDVSESKVVIAARIQPKAGDYVIFLNPKTWFYYVFMYPENSRIFVKDDIVKNEKSGGDMIYPENTSINKIVKDVSKLIGALVKNKKIDIKSEDKNGNIIGLPGIYMADSVSSDNPSDNDDISFDFETDRVYRGISDKGLQTSVKQVKEDLERRERNLKKDSPKRHKIKEEEFNPNNLNVSKGQLYDMFTSSDEALQYLADMTGKRIVIE